MKIFAYGHITFENIEIPMNVQKNMKILTIRKCYKINFNL